MSHEWREHWITRVAETLPKQGNQLQQTFGNSPSNTNGSNTDGNSPDQCSQCCWYPPPHRLHYSVPPGQWPREKNQGHSENHPSSSGSHTPDSAPGKISRISWTFPEHADWTTRLITYCKDNNDFCLKIFSDSTKDVNQQGQLWRQLTVSHDQAYQTLARAVFEHDCDPELRQAITTHPTLFVEPIKQRFNRYIHTLFFMIWTAMFQLISQFRLRTQYKKINTELGTSGAGIDIEELRANPDRANLLGKYFIRLRC